MIRNLEIEANPDVRFGWCLRPSGQMSDAQIRIHRLLEHQYGMIGGGFFMPHATIKGFSRSDAPVSMAQQKLHELGWKQLLHGWRLPAK